MSRMNFDDAALAIAEGQPTIRPLTLVEASSRAAQLMMTEFKELISTLDSDWAKKCFAFLRVHGPSGDAAIRDGNVWALEQWMKTALASVIASGVVVQEIVTPESAADLAKLRKQVAYFNLLPQETAAEAAEAVPAGPTEADLDAEVINHWRTLSTSEIRSKCRDAAYKSRFDRLMNEGRLGR